jgi:hypothetical protein
MAHLPADLFDLAEGEGEMKGFLLLDPEWTLENFGKPISYRDCWWTDRYLTNDLSY